MTKKLTFCSMMAVMGILCLVVSNLLQSNTIFLYLFSTLFTYICTEEYGEKFGLLTFAVIGIAGFMLVANKVGIIAYIIIVGYYPVIKHIIEHFEINMALKYILKIIFAVLMATVAFFVLKQFIIFKMNIGIIYIFGVAMFVAYDIALTMGIRFYAVRLRKLR